MDKEKDINYKYTCEIVCPYCGHEHSNSWEFSDSGVTGCNKCEKKFFYQRDVDVTYISSRTPCANGEAEHEFNLRNDWLINEGTRKGQIQNTCRKCCEVIYRSQK